MTFKVIVIVAVFVSALAQMLLKQAANQQYSTFIRQYLNVWVIGGYIIMIAAMVTNIYAMRHGVLVKEVGVFESFSYLFIPCLSYFFFKEKISVRKMLAIGLIILGVVVFFN